MISISIALKLRSSLIRFYAKTALVVPTITDCIEVGSTPSPIAKYHKQTLNQLFYVLGFVYILTLPVQVNPLHDALTFQRPF